MNVLEHKITALLDLGPVVETEIFPDAASFLNVKNNKGFEKYSRIKMLIDTGSNISGLDRSIIYQLGLKQYEGDEQVNGVGGQYNLKRYSCILYLPIFRDKALPIDVLEGDYSEAPFMGILGRDVLQFCQFTYDGWNNSYKLIAVEI